MINKENIPLDIPVVCALLNPSQEERFFKIMSFCKEKKIRFLHPAFALLEVRFPQPITPKIKVYGFPGSGNMLLQQFIMDSLPQRKLSPEEQFLSNLGLNYFTKFNILLNEGLKKKIINSTYLDPDFSYSFPVLNPFQGGFFVLPKPVKNNQVNHLSFFGFPLLGFSWDVVSGTHGFPSRESIEFFEKKQFKQILVIRDPVDVIFSNIQKLDAKGAILYPSFKLLTYYYSYYLTECLKNKTDVRLLIIKYEDMIYNPQKTFRKISIFLNLKLSDDQLNLWAQKNLFQVLPLGSKDHFKGGGGKKWTSVFPLYFFEFLQKKNIIEKAKLLGYLIQKKDFKGNFLPSDLKNKTKEDGNDLGAMLLVPFWSIDKKYEIFKSPLGLKVYLSAHGTMKNFLNRKKLQPDGDLMVFMDASFWSTPKEPFRVPALSVSEVFS